MNTFCQAYCNSSWYGSEPGKMIGDFSPSTNREEASRPAPVWTPYNVTLGQKQDKTYNNKETCGGLEEYGSQSKWHY